MRDELVRHCMFRGFHLEGLKNQEKSRKRWTLTETEKNKFRAFSPQANYADRVTTACRRS